MCMLSTCNVGFRREYKIKAYYPCSKKLALTKSIQVHSRQTVTCSRRDRCLTTKANKHSLLMETKRSAISMMAICKETSSGKSTRNIHSLFNLHSHSCMICYSRTYTKIRSHSLHTRDLDGPELSTSFCFHIFCASFVLCRTVWLRVASNFTQ
jgi:hypothetical protein